MSGLLHVATMAAHAAGRLMLQAYDRLDRIQVMEKAPNDFVTNVDQAVEHLIIEHIHKYYPGHSILSEEVGAVEPARTIESDAQTRWIIDPIDGTSNFMQGVPHFCTSIAVEKAGKIICGVIYDPIRDETFQAHLGQGATLNQKRIKLSHQGSLKHYVLASGFPRLQSSLSMAQQMAVLNAVMNYPANVRRMGSAALDLAYVAAGRWHGFWGVDLKPWDVAAGLLIALESGVVGVDFSGQPLKPDTAAMIVARHAVLPDLQALILKSLRLTAA
ncbi:MAG: inositol monophosphatase [Legionellales bacterium]|nr:inositol monophosphatase [Legionellales bacterium]|tara:strand:+ start:244 stop:1062 length:819 start_codon:yes stop_codon:yes gene_type:complete